MAINNLFFTLTPEKFAKAIADNLPETLTPAQRLQAEVVLVTASSKALVIAEEKMRLANHLDYYLETMVLPKSGKKLGFISQEIGREINTLGSKSNHAEMQKLVVDMKDNLEKLKEQILNTL